MTISFGREWFTCNIPCERKMYECFNNRNSGLRNFTLLNVVVSKKGRGCKITYITGSVRKSMFHTGAIM